MKRRPVTVIGGGWSGERSISLMSLRGVVEALKVRGWGVDAVDLLPEMGRPRPATPAFAAPLRLSGLLKRLARRPGTVAFLALHGTGGEDGRIQGLLELAGVPFTGSGTLASALAMDKALAKVVLEAAGVPVPKGCLVPKGAPVPCCALPAVVKPLAQGSALGLSLVRSRSLLLEALKRAWRWDSAAVVEEYISGRELTVAVLGGRALPVVEIVPEHEFYDFHSKYVKGGSRHLCPAILGVSKAVHAQDLALRAHRALRCRAFSRTDMILGSDGRFRVLEVNTLPGLTPVSLLPDAARAAGLDYGELLEAMLKSSLEEAQWPSTKD
ncbi:MAG: D-alanine--D-alanine ligase [bacterium]